MGLGDFIDGVGEIISNGADEAAQALFTGNGYTGAEWSPPVPDAPGYEERLIIDSEPAAAPAVEAPAMDTGWGEQAPMGFPEIGFSDNATIIDMEPQIEAMSPDSFIPDYTPSEPQQQQEIEL